MEDARNIPVVFPFKMSEKVLEFIADFKLGESLEEDVKSIIAGQKFIPPESNDILRDRIIGEASLEEKAWYTLGCIYETKGNVLLEIISEECDFSSDPHLYPEYWKLIGRLDSVFSLLRNTFRERFARENILSGFRGIIVDEDFKVWLRAPEAPKTIFISREKVKEKAADFFAKESPEMLFDRKKSAPLEDIGYQ
jgi:hypothetical protein